MAVKQKMASIAQARLLASLWGRNERQKVGGYTDPTIVACVKRGWLVATDIVGVWPSGTPYVGHRVSDTGLDALETFLRQQRYDRTTKEERERADWASRDPKSPQDEAQTPKAKPPQEPPHD